MFQKYCSSNSTQKGWAEITKQTFYRKLRKLKKLGFRRCGSDYFGERGIRFIKDGFYFCPITAVAHLKDSRIAGVDAREHRKVIELSKEDAQEIILAADNMRNHNPKVREALLRNLEMGRPSDQI